MPTQTQFSAGGLVYKKENNQVLWLLRLPRANPKYRAKIVWTFSKGWLDDTANGTRPGPLASGQIKATSDQIQAAALREVAEEGGVKAKIITKLKTIKIFFADEDKNKVLKFITYFLMEYQKDLPQGPGQETEAVIWLSYEAARQKLGYSSERQLLDLAHQKLPAPVQENFL